MDVQITDGVIMLGFAFFAGFMVAPIFRSRRDKKKALALRDSADKFAEASFRHLAGYHGDNLEVLEMLEAGDSEGAKRLVSFELACFYTYEWPSGVSKELDVQKRKIEELAKSSATLAGEIQNTAEMQKKVTEIKDSRLTRRWSQPPLPRDFGLSDEN